MKTQGRDLHPLMLDNQRHSSILLRAEVVVVVAEAIVLVGGSNSWVKGVGDSNSWVKARRGMVGGSRGSRS